MDENTMLGLMMDLNTHAIIMRMLLIVLALRLKMPATIPVTSAFNN